jgi:uncharacterized protein with HEPN domain
MNDLDSRILELIDDIYEAAMIVIDSLQNETIESFIDKSNFGIQGNVAYRLIIIGEATSLILKKYPQFSVQHPEIPFHNARSLRNILVHAYSGVDWKLIWNTAKEHLPLLITTLESFISNKQEK